MMGIFRIISKMEEVGWLSLLEEPHRQQYQPQDQDEQAPGGKHLKSQAQKKTDNTPHQE
jgi:hypothetical protein